MNLNMIEITHCSNLAMAGNQFKSFNSLGDIVEILLSLGTMQNIRNQSVVVSWHYTIIVVNPELKTDFFYIKTLIFDLFF